MSKNNTSKKAPAKKKSAEKSESIGVINWGESVVTAVILFVVCLVITALLAGTNMLTKDRIAQSALAEKEATCAEVIGAETYVILANSDYDVYIAVSGSDVVGCAITTQSTGYGGALSVMTGIDMDGDVTGVKILSHNETPGLGANAEKPSFLGQYVSEDKEGYPDEYAVTKDGGDIDAVTAATISSRAVTDAVNDACEIYEELAATGALEYTDGGEG